MPDGRGTIIEIGSRLAVDEAPSGADVGKASRVERRGEGLIRMQQRAILDI